VLGIGAREQVLYYAALFIQADLESVRYGFGKVDLARIPRASRVLAKGWLFLAPFAALVYTMFALNLEPEYCAMVASAVIVALGFVFGYDGHRMMLKDVWKATDTDRRINSPLKPWRTCPGWSTIGLMLISLHLRTPQRGDRSESSSKLIAENRCLGSRHHKNPTQENTHDQARRARSQREDEAVPFTIDAAKVRAAAIAVRRFAKQKICCGATGNIVQQLQSFCT
jgi:TRAP-type uncharacterized transport system fused permease subunit